MFRYGGRDFIGRPQVSMVSSSIRHKSARFKPKIAPLRAQKSASMMAMDHFDFYYGPLFGKSWPSIRLGLLTPHKYVAVLNNLSEDRESNEGLIRDLDTTELIEKLTKGGLKSHKLIDTTQETIVAMENEDFEGSESLVEPFKVNNDLNEFTPSGGEYTFGQLSMSGTEEPQRQVNITGLEFLNSHLKTCKGFIHYPKNLKVFAYGRDVFDHFPAPLKDKNGWWLLDGGSVLPVLALDLQPGDDVLDMCASPGGKSLMIIQSGLFGNLVCNDAKLSRLGQLRRGLAMYIPVKSELNERIVLKRKDGSCLESWDEVDRYDKVLVDAPCSTDRLSVIDDNGNLFAMGKTQERLNLPQLQTRLLINALRSVKVGGSVVYSTCTLSPSQNESVVENAAHLAQEHYSIQVEEQSLKGMEHQLRHTALFRFADKTQRGTLVVPYIRSNFGPMFVCKLVRRS